MRHQHIVASFCIGGVLGFHHLSRDVLGSEQDDVTGSLRSLLKRGPYNRPVIDISDSIWTPLSSDLVNATTLSTANKSMSLVLARDATPINHWPTTSGFTMYIERLPDDLSVHPVIKREQERNRISRRRSIEAGVLSGRDHAMAILRHHAELKKRGIASGLDIPVKSQSKRGVNNFEVSPAIAPTISKTVALDEDGADVSYFSTVRIGSQSKAFRVVMDSGSSDLWIPAGDCASTACQNHATLAAGDSTTLKISTQPWSIAYGSGSASGFLVQDVLQIAGMQTKSVSFGTASNLSDAFANFPSDGILGLGQTAASAQKVPTFMDNLQSSGLIKRRLCAVNLQRAADSPGVNSKDGQISFGRVDLTKFIGNLVTTPNVAKSGLWEAKLDGMNVNGQAIDLGTSPTGIIDTGTTLVLAPPNIAILIHAAIPGSQSDGSGSYAIPCNTKVTMSLNFGGTQFFIDPRDYLGAATSTAGTMCLSNISGQQIGSASQFLMGDVFLKNVYTVFDTDNNQISFGAKGSTGSTS